MKSYHYLALNFLKKKEFFFNSHSLRGRRGKARSGGIAVTLRDNCFYWKGVPRALGAGFMPTGGCRGNYVIFASFAGTDYDYKNIVFFFMYYS